MLQSAWKSLQSITMILTILESAENIIEFSFRKSRYFFKIVKIQQINNFWKRLYINKKHLS